MKEVAYKNSTIGFFLKREAIINLDGKFFFSLNIPVHVR